ncbi:MAG: hypothetical protein IT221_15440 [Fluviicola sp.]|nr:hypothetical protein [Fluviicola sp.]
MSIFTYKNEIGVVEFHLIIRHNVGFDKKKVLFSNLPIELVEESSPQICKLIASQSKRLDGMTNEILENLSRCVLQHPSLFKYIYPQDVLCGRSLPARNLLKLLKYWTEDVEFIPGTIVSSQLNAVQHYVFTVMWLRYFEFHNEKYNEKIKPITQSDFEKNMLTTEVWKEYNKFKKEIHFEYFWTKIEMGFDCFVMTLDGRPVFEFVG